MMKGSGEVAGEFAGGMAVRRLREVRAGYTKEYRQIAFLWCIISPMPPRLPLLSCFVFLPLLCGALAAAEAGRFLEDHCVSCHDAETKKGGLDLTALAAISSDAQTFAQWVKVHDRIRDGEMPPKDKPRPDAAATAGYLVSLGKELTAVDAARQVRDGRVGLRRMSRGEFENALRDLLGLPGLRVQQVLPADGKSHGFDRAAAALDVSFVHVDAYLAAVDVALNEATPAFVEQPPVFKYGYRPWDNNRHEGREAEPPVVLSVGQRSFVPLIGLERDPTFRDEGFWKLVDDEPHAKALGFFRHEDADFRFSLTAIAPVLSGRHRVRVSGYSFAWDGTKAVATDRTGALGLGIHSTGEHFGTKGLPANKAGVAEFEMWLARSDGHTHGTDSNLRLIMASLENVRDFPHDKNTPGPPLPCPGLAIEWIEIEGPLHDAWPPASQRALFGDLPVQFWTKESGAPQPVQQKWPRGMHGSYPEDIYGENGTKRVAVHVVSAEPDKDSRRLLAALMRRAFRRTIADAEVEPYAALVRERMLGGAHFQDAMKSAYRRVLSAPEFFVPGLAREQFLVASRLSALLWSSLPDEELLALAEKGELTKPEVLRAQTERMLRDARAARFAADFTGQWLRMREVESNPPDKQLYPEFMPWLMESMLAETHAFFAELLSKDLSVTNFVQSDFAMINEPLARHYGIDGVSGFELRRVPLPPDSVRGGFLTQGAVLKVTANGTTTSPVKRGAFVMEQVMGIVPTPPPPDAGAIEPDTRGATTIREQLEKHKRNATCAGCHVKMDPYGFALESFDVTGGWREAYRVRGAPNAPTGSAGRPAIHGRGIEYHMDRPVDCTGVMPDGSPFKDIRELRALLAAEPDKLARAFAGHLITYATGAEVSFADRAEVERILREARPGGYGVRSLLAAVIASPLFARP